jgi:hypothetical protein
MTKTRDEIRADLRGDLIKRLFAVAISVGAASTLAHMQWVIAGRWPDLGEWQQLAILGVAMTATVLSWDGYLMSIHDRPLLGFWRFAIDIGLVFIYMFLLMTSQHTTWWLPIHAITYTLYAIWDLLSVREYTKQYYGAPNNDVATIRGVYWRGLRDINIESRGPIITLAWGIYFWGLVLINYDGLRDRIFITSLFALAGLVLYRRDKRIRYPMLFRTALIVSLLIGSALYVKYGAPLADQRIWNFIHSYIG